mmetsp:Transcript_92355/g.239137  ORF Transcript_92355/g.239137 Transcript_92355/m.239137 type:complete len:255 (+) Transcript_92355:146-910(+)
MVSRATRRPAAAVVAAALGVACLLWSSAFVGLTSSSAAAQGAAQRTRLSAVMDPSGLTPGGPVVAYSDALASAAASQGESVPVTKDVMKVKSLFKDTAFLNELQFIVNNPTVSLVGKASGMVELMQPLESTVLPKFVTFLAKKKRLQALQPVVEEYMNTLYETQNIMPVRVKSAQPLTEEQKEAIKEKMKAKLGASDIKLVCQIEPTLIAGLTVEYGFVDPEQLGTPTSGEDMSMKTYLESAALNQGVVATAGI